MIYLLFLLLTGRPQRSLVTNDMSGKELGHCNTSWTYTEYINTVIHIIEIIAVC